MHFFKVIERLIANITVFEEPIDLAVLALAASPRGSWVSRSTWHTPGVCHRSQRVPY